MTSRVKPNNYNYFAGGALACIILLLSGPILYYFYTPNLSFANRAYGQVGTVEVEDGRVKIGHGQVGNVEVEDGRVKIGHGQVGNVDDERLEGSSGSSGSSSSNADEARTPPKSTQDTKSEDSLLAQQAQPTTAPTTTPTENAKGEDNTSAQSTGPVRFTFVDSFWTDYTSLGGVVASTSSETTTAQPLPPAIKQE